MGERGLYRRVQMKAHGEVCAGPTGQPFFAAQILAIGSEKELPSIAQAEALPISVMRRRDPLLAFVLGPFASDRGRGAAEGTVRTNLDRIGVGHHQHRVRGACPRDARPARFGAAVGTAIDDHALTLMTHLKRQHAGMGSLIETARRGSSSIHD